DRVRLQALRQQLAEMQHNLKELQKGLVSPERMSSLLEDILRRNGKLRLIALKTLPVATIGEEADKVAPPSSGAASSASG
ncbi:type 4a pilus biogenesis protein PilO, partial [Salmonella enterica subsp. enterica serovar Typhimurium]|nr:type 4a pilus biogenesis protein PilO [Salmonella enterica subsp. enterica serovar Typhimurium]